MKKMLLAFAVMACAAVAQAVTLNWTTASANPWVTESMTCSFIYAADADATIADATQVALGATVEGYNVVGTDWSILTDNGNEGWVKATAETYTPATTGVYFIVFTEGDSYAATSVAAADATTAWSPTVGPTPAPYEGPVTVADFQTGVVPEPTALALLALGVAGLALRRRA